MAENINTQELVVIKIIKFNSDSEWEDFKLLEREAQTLENLSNPAIPQYLDYFELKLPHYPHHYPKILQTALQPKQVKIREFNRGIFEEKEPKQKETSIISC